MGTYKEDITGYPLPLAVQPQSIFKGLKASILQDKDARQHCKMSFSFYTSPRFKKYGRTRSLEAECRFAVKDTARDNLLKINVHC
jgi:hypothetical protein